MLTRIFIPVLIFAFSCLQNQQGIAQEINGDTLYTSVRMSVILHFPSPVTYVSFSEGAKDQFHTVIFNAALVINAKKENASPARLQVREGNRRHSFVLMFKSSLSPDEVSREWSTIDLLSKYVAEHNYSAATPASSKNLSTIQPSADSITTKAPGMPTATVETPQTKTQTALENEKEFKMKMAAGNKDLAEKNFISARQNFLQAQDLQPVNATVLKAINKINEKLDSVALVKKTDEQYEAAIAQANAYIGTLEYDKAIAAFQTALSLKPKEFLPQSMIEHVKYAQQSLVRTQRKKDSLALVAQTRETLDLANQEALNKNWEAAKKLYEKVLDLQPSKNQADLVKNKLAAIEAEFKRQGEAKNKLAQIETPPQKTPDVAQASDKKKTNDPPVVRATVKTQTAAPKAELTEKQRLLNRKIEINNWMDKAQQAYNTREWDSATVYYKRAINLFLSADREMYARRKLVDIQLEQAREKGATEEQIDSLRLAIQLRDKQMSETVVAVLDTAQSYILAKKWDSALLYYQQALTLDLLPTQEQFARNKVKTIEFELGKTVAGNNADQSVPAHEFDARNTACSTTIAD